MIRPTLVAAVLLAAFSFGLTGCKTTPRTEEKREALDANVKDSLEAMRREDPSFGDFIDRAYAYAVYPTVGKGGLIVSGTYGHGQVFEQGRFIGYSDITQINAGATIGGQAYTEVVALEDKAALDKFTSDAYAFTAQVNAVALKSGVAKTAKFRDGVAVFYYAKGGLMADASVGGQRFRFDPASR